MKDNSFCYDGIGALKSGTHTRKQLLNVMNKNFKQRCPEYIKSLRCKSCKQHTLIWKRINKKSKKNPDYVLSPKLEKKTDSIYEQCKRCKKTSKKCNLKQYLLFSGANVGKCVKNEAERVVEDS